MKRFVLILLLLCGFQISSTFGQSPIFETHEFYCSNINTIDKYDGVKHYLTTNYGDHFSGFSDFNPSLNFQLTTDVEPIDVLQILRNLSYTAIYKNGGVDYYLSPDGASLRAPKQ